MGRGHLMSPSWPAQPLSVQHTFQSRMFVSLGPLPAMGIPPTLRAGISGQLYLYRYCCEVCKRLLTPIPTGVSLHRAPLRFNSQGDTKACFLQNTVQ